MRRGFSLPGQFVSNNLRTGLKKTTRLEIPRKTIYRLSVYLRCLQRLKGNSIRTVSSEALAKAAGVKSTQLRKDLTYFGQFGTRGLGYDVEQLAQMITERESLGHELQRILDEKTNSWGITVQSVEGDGTTFTLEWPVVGGARTN